MSKFVAEMFTNKTLICEQHHSVLIDICVESCNQN